MTKPPAYAIMKGDQITSGEGIPDVKNLDEMMFIIASKESIEAAILDHKIFSHAKRHVDLIKTLCTENTTAAITLTIDGYDDDPRDLWNIPEAADYILLFASVIRAIGYPPKFMERLSEASIKWVEATHNPPATKQ